MGKISKVWQHFDKINKQSAKCKMCGKVCSTAGNTSNLHSHLKNIHRESSNRDQAIESNSEPVSVSKSDLNIKY